MDLRHARTFVTVAELGTVSKAALRLRIAQPALRGRSSISRTNSACGCSIASDGVLS